MFTKRGRAGPLSSAIEHMAEFEAASRQLRSSVAPLWSLLLPAAYVAHLCEEWWGGPGFPAWASITLGVEVSPERFLLINAVALPIFLAGSIAAVKSARLSWLAAAFASLLLLNGLLHLLATLAFATYSPGTITGAILYLPLGALLLLVMSRSLSWPVLTFAVSIGICIQVVVAVAAFVWPAANVL